MLSTFSNKNQGGLAGEIFGRVFLSVFKALMRWGSKQAQDLTIRIRWWGPGVSKIYFAIETTFLFPVKYCPFASW